MKRITVSTQILDGNLGDGWADNYESACGLADFSRAIWEKDLAGFASDGYEICFNIDVESGVVGCSRSLTVDVDNSDIPLDELWDITREAENCLTDEGRIWEMFCASSDAEEFFSE